MRGSQRPRIFTAPTYATSAGQDAVDLAAHAGLYLEPWQALVLEHGLGELRDGRHSAFEVCATVPRQNGKGSIIEARELAGLFLLGEKLILHSAHLFSTAAEGFRRIEALIDGTPELRKKVKQVKHGTAERSIELKSGQRLLFLARSGKAGRGLTADAIMFDESQHLGFDAVGAMLPTLSTVPDPQVWYFGSAGLSDSEQLHALRARGLRGDKGEDVGSLVYFEWSIDAERDDPMDPRSWARSNPAYGTRIPADFFVRSSAAMPPAQYAREVLGVWETAGTGGLFTGGEWSAAYDETSQIVGPVSYAVEVSQDRRWSCIGVAGLREDGLWHVEVVENQPGTAWVAARCAELVERHGGSVALSPSSPAGSLVGELEALGVEVQPIDARAYSAACGSLYDKVQQSQVRHLGQGELDAAVAGARKRMTTDTWVFDRKHESIDISPLVAVTLAAHAYDPIDRRRSVYEDSELLIA